jgi:hypothetical protein
MADWLLMLDSDTVVANMSNSMDRFLDGPQHLMLTLRANREVASGVMAIRSSEFGHCFFIRWIKLMAAQKLLGLERNADNGALLLAVAELLDARLATKCNKLASSSKSYLEFVDCWEEIFVKFALLAHITNHPVKVIAPLSGYWREHNRGDDGIQINQRCRPDGVLRRVSYTR